MSKGYQVIARKFRPQSFKEVVGQNICLQTLINAIKGGRTANAYLFCGSRGTGKTTIARIFAKALNCKNLSQECEPCNQCSSCLEITNGYSLDVLEIDGASNRGIDDIRQINETVGYQPASGNYKIYLIDEVHMLTKEAFNALLKTLEEPPPTVKFFFCTTEPHRIPLTILSRCQQFALKRIPPDQIVRKLQHIAHELEVSIEEEALHLIAKNAEGSLRDAESLFDQILSCLGKKLEAKAVQNLFGLVSREAFFALDKAGKENRLAFAFELATQIFEEGKDLGHFLEDLTQHFRAILLAKLNPKESTPEYLEASKGYLQEQALSLLEYLIEEQKKLKTERISRFAIEAILLHILQSHKRLHIETLVNRLLALEKAATQKQFPLEVSDCRQREGADALNRDESIAKAMAEERGKADTQKSPSERYGQRELLTKGKDETILRFAAVELEGTIKR